MREAYQKGRFLSEKACPMLIEELQKVSTDTAIRATAQVVADKVRRDWAREHNLVPAGGQRTWTRLIGRAPWHPPPLPGEDHGRLWNRDGKAVCYTIEPYGFKWADLAALVDLCRDNGLEASITPTSPYFPGYAVMIEIWRAGVARFPRAKTNE